MVTVQQYGLLHLELWRVGADKFDIGIASAPPVETSNEKFDIVRFISTGGLDVECEIQEALTWLGKLDNDSIESLDHFFALLLPDDDTPDKEQM